MAAQFFRFRAPFDTGGMRRGQRQELIEVGFEAGEVDFERSVGEPGAPTPDAASAADQVAQSRSEYLVALVDDELGVAQQMSEADLVLFFRQPFFGAEG